MLLPHRYAWGVSILVGLLGAAVASACMPLIFMFLPMDGLSAVASTVGALTFIMLVGCLFFAVCVRQRWHQRRRSAAWFEDAFGSDAVRVLDTVDAEFLADWYNREGSLRHSPTAVMLVREKYRYLPEVAAHEVVRLAVARWETSSTSPSILYGFDHPLGGVPRVLAQTPQDPRWELSAVLADRLSLPTLRIVARVWRLLPYIVPSVFWAIVVSASLFSAVHPGTALLPWALALASIWVVANVGLYPTITRLALVELPLCWYRQTMASSPETMLDAAGHLFDHDITQMANTHGVGGPAIDAVRVRFRELAAGDIYFRMPYHVIVEVIRAAQKRNAAETVLHRANAVLDAESLVSR